jgi:hypothetical protein
MAWSILNADETTDKNLIPSDKIDPLYQSLFPSLRQLGQNELASNFQDLLQQGESLQGTPLARDVPEEGKNPAEIWVRQNRRWDHKERGALLHPCLIRRPVAGHVTITEHLRPAAKATAGKGQYTSSHSDNEHERNIVHHIISRPGSVKASAVDKIPTHAKRPNNRARSTDFRAERISVSCATRLLTISS